MDKIHDWQSIRDLYAKLERSETIPRDTDTHDLCRRVARDVVVDQADVERALLTPSDTETLVRELRRRIFEGSRRLSKALLEVSRRKKAGDFSGARAVLEQVLAVEVVPLYREQAEVALDYVDEPEE